MNDHLIIRNRLLALYPDNPYGYWEIRGEDSNCDLGGSHNEPLLTHYEGNYNDAVKLALSLTGFFSWGGGGSIRKVPLERMSKHSIAYYHGLKELQTKLKTELEEVENAIRDYGEVP